MDNLYYEKLINGAIRYVSYRPRSEKELRDFLQKKIAKWKLYAPTLLDKTVSRMRDLGYVDDAKFAAWWVEQRNSFRPKGARLVKIELAKKGIARDVIEGAVAHQDASGALEEAKRAIDKKRASWALLPALARKQKVYGYLGRRGFDGETIARVIDDWDKNGYTTR